MEDDRLPEETDEFAISVLEERVGRETQVARLLDIAERAEDATEAKEALQRLADVYENDMSDREAAFTVLQAALARDPTDRVTLRELERMGAQLGRWSELLETYQDAVAGLEARSVEAAGEIWTRIARIYTQNLPSLEHAEHAVGMALTFDPEGFEVLAAQAEIQRRRGEWPEFIETLKRQLSVTRDPSVKIDLYLSQGDAFEAELGDTLRAIQAYEAALALDPAAVEALTALERLYAECKQWERHMTVLESHLPVARSQTERIGIYRRMATVAEEFLGDPERAARCLEAILARDENDRDARVELERICKEQGRWTELLDAYRRRLQATADPHVRLQLLRLCAEIHEQKLDDVAAARQAWAEVLAAAPDDIRALEAMARLHHRLGEDAGDDTEAEHHLREALRLDPTSVPAMRDLAKVYRGRGEWLKAAQLYQHADEQAGNGLDKVQLRYEAARLFHDKLRDWDRARPLFEGVLALDPEHVGAGRAVAEYLIRAGRPKEAEPILSMLARRAAAVEMSLEDKLDIYVKAGRCALVLGSRAKASGFFANAAACDATHVPALLGLAEIAFHEGDFAEAEKCLRAALDRQKRQNLRGRTIAETIHKLGDCRRRRGDLEGALVLYQKAWKVSPERETLRALIELHKERGEYEAAIRGKQILLEQVEDPERVEIYKSVAELHLIGRRDTNKAISALRQALLLAPRDRSLLQRLLEASTEAERWKDTVALTMKIGDLEEDPFKRGKYHLAAALVYRDKLRRLDQTVAHLELALDDFFAVPERVTEEQRPGCLKAFTDLERILAGERDWRRLERSYRKMIHRLPAGDPLLPVLWHNLGEIYRGRLGEVDNAVKAFEVAEKLQPDAERARIIAEMLATIGPQEPGGIERAVQKRFELLEADPYNADHYRHLLQLYLHARELDKCWCVCRALAFYRRANVEEQRFFTERRTERSIPRDAIDAGSWKLVRHPGENLKISAVLAAVRDAVVAVKAVPRERLAAKPADKGLGAKAELYRRSFARFARLLGVPSPDLYFRLDDPGGLLLLALTDKGRTRPAFVVHADHIRQHRSNVDIDVAAARALMFLRPEYTLRLLLPTMSELTVVFLAALAGVRADFAVPRGMRQAVAQYLPVLRQTLQPQLAEQLALVAGKLMGEGTLIDLDGWCHAVDATARRVGLAMCGDLELSARMIAAEPVLVGSPKTTDRIKELICYSVSEPYFQLRHRLGTTVV